MSVCGVFFIFGLMLNGLYQNNMLDIISYLSFCFRFQFGTVRRANLAVNQWLNVERESCANTRLNGSIQASPTSQAKTCPSSHLNMFDQNLFIITSKTKQKTEILFIFEQLLISPDLKKYIEDFWVVPSGLGYDGCKYFQLTCISIKKTKSCSVLHFLSDIDKVLFLKIQIVISLCRSSLSFCKLGWIKK